MLAVNPPTPFSVIVRRAGRAGGAAGFQRGRHDDGRLVRRAAVNQVQRMPGRHPSDLPCRLRHRAQIDRGGHVRTVEPEYGDILGHAQAHRLQIVDDGQRQLIRPGADGGRTVGHGDQRGHGLPDGIPVVDIDEEHAAISQSQFGDFVLIAAGAGVEAPIVAGDRVRAAEEAEPAVAKGGQIPYDLGLGAFVVDGDGHLAVGQVGGVDGDDGHGHAHQRPFLLLVERKAGDDQGVGVPVGRQVGEEACALLGVADAVDGQVVAGGGQDVDEPFQQRAVEPAADALAGEQGDAFGASAGQIGRGAGGRVVEFGGGREHLLPGGGGDVRLAAQGA